MNELIKEVKELQEKRDYMLCKYGERCTNSRGRTNSIITNNFKANQLKLSNLVIKGTEFYGEEFLKALR